MIFKYRDENLFHDDVKKKMHEMIVQRIIEVTRLKEQALEGYSDEWDESLKSSAFALNAAFGMEIAFLNKLLLVR